MTPEDKDTLITGIILKSIQGNETAEEREILKDWLSKSNRNKKTFAEIYAAASQSGIKFGDTDSAIARLNAAVDGYEAASRHYSGVFRRARTWLAAAAAVALFAVGGIFLSRSLSPKAKWLTAENSTAETETIQLEDGSKVFLRPSSSIRYSVGEEAVNREVSIDGEAFFDVAHSAEKPFIVHTKDISVKVLGTMFSVSSKANTAEPTSVILEKGSVKILSPKGDGMVTLKPDQKAVYKSVTGDLDVDTFKAKPYLVEKFSLQTIEDATLPQIIKKIEKSYGVTIKCEEPMDSTKYNLNYQRTNKIEDIVSIIEIMTGKDLILILSNDT